MTIASWHNHTIYSMLDGMSKIPDLVGEAKRQNMTAIGISDHGHMGGVLQFYKECVKQDIKPLLGVEFYHADDRLVRSNVRVPGNGDIDGSNKQYYHLSVYARNNDGYHNLIRLNSDAWQNGYHRKARCDYDSLEEFSNGLIIGSGCLGGPVLQALLNNNFDAALQVAGRLQDIVGPEFFFVEMMDHSLPEQKQTNPALVEIARKLQAPLIATYDSHYTHKHEHDAHDTLLCHMVKRTKGDPDRFRFDSDEYYLKTAEEMRERFSWVPEAIDNSIVMAEKVDVTIEFGEYHLPKFNVPAQYSSDDEMLEALVKEGLKERYGDNQDAVERASYELEVIQSMGFSSYFLILWDVIKFTQRERIMTGSGRGSSGGSIVSYALGITKIDPLRHKLIFERFLNPSRVTMPDIDLDFAPSGRERVINYLRETYGSDHVAQIITYSTVKSRKAVRTAARIMELPFAAGDAVAKALPPLTMGRDTPLLQVLDRNNPMGVGLRDLYENDDDVRRIVNAAIPMEGTLESSGMHAAGILVTPGPVSEYVPVSTAIREKGSKERVPVAQYNMIELEELGLLKMDILGLTNLDTLQLALKYAGLPWDFLETLPLDDRRTYELLSSGNTLGVFQLDSKPIQDLLVRIQPDSIDDISAVLALYRPGPMAENLHYEYAERKHGRSPVVPFHPDASDILADTYQLVVGQEQVMFLAQRFAGYTMAESDNLRRSIGKKSLDLMAAEKGKFVQGCINQGYSEELGDSLFHQIESHANYSFNFCLTSDVELLRGDGSTISIAELFNLLEAGESVELMSYLEGEAVPDECVQVWSEGVKDVLEVTMEDGSTFKATANHRFMCEDGVYRELGEIIEKGYEILNA